MNADPNTSSSTQKALDILLLFDDDNIYFTVEDISVKLEMPISTVYRHVRILCDNGLLEKSHDNQYSLGMTFLRLSRVAYNSNRDLRLLTLPIMQRIAEHVHESVSLMRLFNNEVICIENIEGQHSLRVTIEPGRVHKLHAGASAKVILAHLPETEWKERLHFPLERFTPTTIVDFDALVEELHTIKAQGYSVSHGEIDEGAIAIAVPILNTKRQIIAALSIEGPAIRMDDNRLLAYQNLLKEEVKSIQKFLR